MGKQTLERREHPLFRVDVDAEVADHLQSTVLRHQGSLRASTDERPPTPPVAVVDRLEQEPLVVADDSGECGDGGGEIRQDLGPHRHHRVVGCQSGELVEIGADPHQVKRSVSASSTAR